MLSNQSVILTQHSPQDSEIDPMVKSAACGTQQASSSVSGPPLAVRINVAVFHAYTISWFFRIMQQGVFYFLAQKRIAV